MTADGSGSRVTEQRGGVTDALAADLAEVAAALDLPPETVAGFVDALQSLARDAALAVRSLVGLSLVCALPHGEAVLTALRAGARPGDIAASLRVPVAAGTAATGGDCVFVLYADQPHAFVDLAETVRRSLGEDADELAVDQHLELPPGTDLSAFRHAAVHDLAEGALIGRGFTEVGASTFLEALATTSGDDPTAAAQQVLRSIR